MTSGAVTADGRARVLADNPFPPLQTNRHHQLKGKLKGFWEYEVDGGRACATSAAPTIASWSSWSTPGPSRQTPTDRRSHARARRTRTGGAARRGECCGLESVVPIA